MPKDPTATFTASLTQSKRDGPTGIVVPPDIIEQLDSGKRPPVRVTINGHEYRTTIGIMAGNAMIPVSAAVRKAAGVAGGDQLDVKLVVDMTPRAVEIPADLASAFAANPSAETFFGSLSNSLQRYHIDNLMSAKTEETRQRRVDKAIALFLEGKQR